ncbi:MAG: aminotransferase class I/II-fold pyridoxal phosphate-dependent enzyme [Vicinamibacterales bacterium]
MPKVRSAARVHAFADSVFGEMTRLSLLHDAVNLSQGFPDFAAPPSVKDAACAAIRADINQYGSTWGTPDFREGIAREFTRRYGVPVDSDQQVTVCCGSTEAMIATMLAVVDPGDEVIVFEPFYENYGPDAILAGAVPRYVRLHAPEWTLDPDELRKAFSNRTRAIVINTPANPTGKVFTRAELRLIADLCQQWDVLAIADEIYEHMVYDGLAHVPMASMPGMADRTVTIGGLSKTFSVTGWRIGWTIAPPPLSAGIRKMHDFLTVCAPAPLQEAGVVAMALPESYYTEMCAEYQRRRDLLLEVLAKHGFRCWKPQGAYYVMADVSQFGYADDYEFARYLVSEFRVATIPGSSFYIDPKSAPPMVRFCYAKRDETIHEADRRLAAFAARADHRKR